MILVRFTSWMIDYNNIRSLVGNKNGFIACHDKVATRSFGLGRRELWAFFQDLAVWGVNWWVGKLANCDHFCQTLLWLFHFPVWVPCSRVGHVYRAFMPYNFGNTQWYNDQVLTITETGELTKKAKGPIITINYKRVIEVWMDEEYKKFFYTRCQTFQD